VDEELELVLEERSRSAAVRGTAAGEARLRKPPSRVVDSDGCLKFSATMEHLPDSDLAQRLFWLTGAVAFAVATVGGISAGVKYWLELNARRWDRAHEAYEGFLDVAIAHPQFVAGYWSDPARTPEERNRYRWFMARFLWASEQALLRVGWRRRKEWEKVVRVMLREHADFIASPATRDEVDCYYGPLRRLIRETIEEARMPSPAPLPKA
jgi:hypothetical protein